MKDTFGRQEAVMIGTSSVTAKIQEAEELSGVRQIFDEGEAVGTHAWKHQIWRSIPRDRLEKVMYAARYFYGSEGMDCERIRKNPDDSYDFEAVYACEGDIYSIEDWDGTVLIGPNRRVLGQMFPRGVTVVLKCDAGQVVGTILRHSKKTLTISHYGTVSSVNDDGKYMIQADKNYKSWRIPWELVESSLTRIRMS